MASDPNEVIGRQKRNPAEAGFKANIRNLICDPPVIDQPLLLVPFLGRGILAG